MRTEPQVLVDARAVLDRASAGTGSRAELEAVRDRLRSVASHPSCDAALGDRMYGAVLVCDLLLLAMEPPVGAMAG